MIRRRARSEPHSGRSVVPEATVARLPLYLRVLTTLAEGGVHTVSSDTLAAAAGVTPAKVRKDLSHLGSYGTRGVGYEVDVLLDCIAAKLGLTEDRSVVLVGVGNLGHALAGYGGFHARGFRIVALVDADPERVGERVGSVIVRPVDELERVIVECTVTIGVICTPAAAAQQVCDRLVAAGVTSILNFAPTVLSVPEGVDVRKVDLAVELQILSFHEARKRPSAPREGPPGGPALAGTGAVASLDGTGADGASPDGAWPDRARQASQGFPAAETAADGRSAGETASGETTRVRTETDEVVRVTRQAGQTRPAQAVRQVGPVRESRLGQPAPHRVHTGEPSPPSRGTPPGAGAPFAGDRRWGLAGGRAQGLAGGGVS
ncbi:Redox-sensing transcriptional repressor rex (partial match) [Frankia alni ACN14a]|uniref:Redox-sensing transcriptional repressor Rex n=1 Tax=Frankia alni (strain DSM 45986 / CECT 9034 / ACN14a) TaxID=326424 RepID=Q0RS18_FRAAA|nr:Redox-sensing transcriptional repressor rex (partial match) [Frankia alni ACN14a]